MPVGILEVDPAAAIPLVDLVPLAATRIGPIGQVPFPNARKYLVEFGLGYQEGVMLRNDLAIGASVRLHDPARGITARPRIVSVTHFGSEVTDDKVPRPVIELSSAPLSLLRAITTLEANAA